jgi:hypothetical protein
MGRFDRSRKGYPFPADSEDTKCAPNNLRISVLLESMGSLIYLSIEDDRYSSSFTGHRLSVTNVRVCNWFKVRQSPESKALLAHQYKRREFILNLNDCCMGVINVLMRASDNIVADCNCARLRIPESHYINFCNLALNARKGLIALISHFNTNAKTNV